MSNNFNQLFCLPPKKVPLYVNRLSGYTFRNGVKKYVIKNDLDEKEKEPVSFSPAVELEVQ